jgi:hypothetical protein
MADSSFWMEPVIKWAFFSLIVLFASRTSMSISLISSFISLSLTSRFHF